MFRQGETFSGLLVPLFRRSLAGATKQGFVAMNEALKREAEKSWRLIWKLSVEKSIKVFPVLNKKRLLFPKQKF